MLIENLNSNRKPRSRGAALIKTNAQVRSEMVRIYRSFNAGDMTMEEMNKRIAVLDKIRLTLIKTPKSKLDAQGKGDANLTIREKLILNQIERGLERRIYKLLQEFVKVQVAQTNQA
ncbi:MAG: hypothetical protein OEQ24_11915 [Gammaproteobacteria bacterium]|nr:hypothetical protein [Gammaproteobacteria bacterium]